MEMKIPPAFRTLLTSLRTRLTGANNPIRSGGGIDCVHESSLLIVFLSTVQYIKGV